MQHNSRLSFPVIYMCVIFFFYPFPWCIWLILLNASVCLARFAVHAVSLSSAWLLSSVGLRKKVITVPTIDVNVPTCMRAKWHTSSWLEWSEADVTQYHVITGSESCLTDTAKAVIPLFDRRAGTIFHHGIKVKNQVFSRLFSPHPLKSCRLLMLYIGDGN